MSNDFINRRNLSNRSRPSSPVLSEFELILIPEFDSFYYHNPPGTQGGSKTQNVNGSGHIDEATENVIGLLNPWNDGADIPAEGGMFGVLVKPRTPIRTLLGFNLSAIPTNASVFDAKLLFTISSHKSWLGTNPFG